MWKYIFILLITAFNTPIFAADAPDTISAVLANTTTRVASTTYVDKITAELDKKVDLESEQTITGQKTFDISPIVPIPPLPKSL